MKPLLMLTMLVAAATGCKRVPPPPVVLANLPADNPSILVNPPYPGKDRTGSSPTFSKMYAVGSSKAENDRLSGNYQSSGSYTLQRGDGAEINPEEVASELRRWIGSAPGVKVTGIAEDARLAGKISSTIDYETAGTIGYAVYVIEPATPAKKVLYKVDIRERRR